MASITPAPGKGSYVKVKSAVLKAASWRRERTAGELEFPTTGMTADADGNYEVPHGAGLIKTVLVLSGPYDTAAAFHSATYDLRAGVVVNAQVGMVSTLITPAINYVVLSTTDENEAAALGRWEARLSPTTDTSAGYFTVANP